MSGSTKDISLHVRDQKGTAYTVRLAVAEQSETGTLSILTPAGEVAQRFELTHLKKGEDGTRLTCHVTGTTATMSLEHDGNSPELHVAASLFVSIFDAIYRLDHEGYQCAIEWINGLSIGKLA
jgi:hypothetical protein